MFTRHELYAEDIQHILSNDLEWQELFHSKILITGATGMIGTVLVDALMTLNMQQNADIKVIAIGRSRERMQERFCDYLGRREFQIMVADVNQPFQPDEDVDYLFHCASNTHPKSYATDPIGTIMTNILGTDHVLQCALHCHAKRSVFLSTVEVYGENRGDVELFEEDYCGYMDCNTLRAGYPEGKRAGEALCQAYRKQYHLDIVIPRICRVYGPTLLSSDSKALSQFIHNAVNQENIVLKSEGMQHYSYCYVADVVSALFYILLKGEDGEAYNVADARSDIHLKDLAAILADCAGTEVVFQLPDAVEAAGFSKATKALLSAERLKGLGWSAQETIRTGLERTIEILRQNAEK